MWVQKKCNHLKILGPSRLLQNTAFKMCSGFPQVICPNYLTLYLWHWEPPKSGPLDAGPFWIVHVPSVIW